MNQPSTHTLLITPDQVWASTLYTYLWQNGFAPLTIAPNGASALAIFAQVPPNLVLIDLQLSDHSAIDLCVEMLLTQPEAKIVLVTGAHSEPPLVALHAGVAACITRDFPPAAWPGLLAYVMQGGMAFSRNVVETVLADAWSGQKRQSLVTVGPLWIDLTKRLVQYAGQHIQLTPREFSLLICLARNTDRVVTFDQLLNEVWGYDANNGTPAQVRLYIARLRRKLMEEAHTPDFICTERGIGYRLHSDALCRGNPRIAHTPKVRAGHVIRPTNGVHHHAITGHPVDPPPYSN
jgi:DNA-binding response OmpR family regulator